jgi:N-acetylmuramoyl-L-alanine amidase
MLVLLDNGHGALINNEYQTSGKRSPLWSDGSQLFEGEFNRAIVNGIIEELTRLKIPYVNIAPEYNDITLETRVKRANKYPSAKTFYLSIHSNAGGGTGTEVFSSPGTSKSDLIATIFGEEFQKEFPTEKLRTDFSDGDLDKEQHFYVLTKTNMPAILTENFFMDTETECKNILMTREGRTRIIRYHVAAILRVKIEVFKEN